MHGFGLRSFEIARDDVDHDLLALFVRILVGDHFKDAHSEGVNVNSLVIAFFKDLGSQITRGSDKRFGAVGVSEEKKRKETKRDKMKAGGSRNAKMEATQRR
jgi:hypothetical protein